MYDRLARLWYNGCYWISASAFTLGFSFRSEGFQNVPATGPALLLANHQSFLDPPMIGVAARRPLTYLARKTLFRNPVFSTLISSLGAVPVNQEGFAREGLQAVIGELQAGKAVLVFPEGERTLSGHMNPLKPGIHLILKKVRTPVLPVGIAGAYDAWKRGGSPKLAPLFPPLGKGTVAVSIGKPFPSSRFDDLPRDHILTTLFDEIYRVQKRAERLRARR